MHTNTQISTNQPQFQPNFPKHEHSDDPFTIVEGHYVGDDGFVVPNNFIEFFERFPDYVRLWVHKHAIWCPAADAEDLTQELILHMQQLPMMSKHRLPGANHRLNGCRDVIETFDPYKQHGASERRFRNYMNLCLMNRLRSIHSKASRDALSQEGNLAYGEENGLDTPGSVDDEYLHANSDEYRNRVLRSEKQQEERVFATEFMQFVRRQDPSVVHSIAAISETATHTDAARRLGLSDYEYFRLHERLCQLARSYVTGAKVPCPRRRYRRRNASSSKRMM